MEIVKAKIMMKQTLMFCVAYWNGFDSSLDKTIDAYTDG